MKILAVNMAHRQISNVIAVVSHDELRTILGKSYETIEVRTGDDVRISERCRHALTVEDGIAKAKGVSSQLRTLADMLEMSHPALTQIASDESSE